MVEVVNTRDILCVTLMQNHVESHERETKDGIVIMTNHIICEM